MARAAREFLPQFPDVHLLYVGDDVCEFGKSTVAQIGDILGPELQPRLHCLPRQPRPVLQAIMAKARVLAFPSTFESMGLVAGEALWQRTPVIASNIPPFTEYLEDRQTALLVSPHDPHALAEAVAWVLAHPRSAREMARRGREMMEQRFSVARCVRETLDFYRECLGLRAEPSRTPSKRRPERMSPCARRERGLRVHKPSYVMPEGGRTPLRSSQRSSRRGPTSRPTARSSSLHALRIQF